ncbi:retinol dehydrogenase 13-like [Galendromus occidentalis]|uniref:Retinol dehydrogenase 13-like n=1 Tax=Galendromus occidentalis TaxID=34638 RepID=A0AAJ6VV91_9ACAR|nr:retinol dehydrogenase 13-like [Galendromus occidentalis]
MTVAQPDSGFRLGLKSSAAPRSLSPSLSAVLINSSEPAASRIRTILITGANRGIGYETAKQLALRGIRLILACRNTERAEAAVRSLVEETGNREISFRHVDLACLKSVDRCAVDLLNSETHLNAVILNAGMFSSERRVSSDGYELQFASNYLGHFHLANSLVPLLRFGAPSRIIVVASESHRLIDQTFLNDIQMEHGYKRCQAFARSKLCEIILAREMAKRVRSKRIVVNALHPGMVPTDLFRGTWMRTLAKLFGTSAERAAISAVYLAVDDSVADVTGAYFVKRRITRPSPEAENDDIGSQLWTMSEELVHRALSE